MALQALDCTNLVGHTLAGRQNKLVSQKWMHRIRSTAHNHNRQVQHHDASVVSKGYHSASLFRLSSGHGPFSACNILVALDALLHVEVWVSLPVI